MTDVKFFCFVLSKEEPPHPPTPLLADILRILIFINRSVDDWKCSLLLVLNMSMLIYYYYYYYYYYYHHHLLYAGYFCLYS